MAYILRHQNHAPVHSRKQIDHNHTSHHLLYLLRQQDHNSSMSNPILAGAAYTHLVSTRSTSQQKLVQLHTWCQLPEHIPISSRTAAVD